MVSIAVVFVVNDRSRCDFRAPPVDTPRQGVGKPISPDTLEQRLDGADHAIPSLGRPVGTVSAGEVPRRLVAGLGCREEQGEERLFLQGVGLWDAADVVEHDSREMGDGA